MSVAAYLHNARRNETFKFHKMMHKTTPKIIWTHNLNNLLREKHFWQSSNLEVPRYRSSTLSVFPIFPSMGFDDFPIFPSMGLAADSTAGPVYSGLRVPRVPSVKVPLDWRPYGAFVIVSCGSIRLHMDPIGNGCPL